jgi:hypothetical protein
MSYAYSLHKQSVFLLTFQVALYIYIEEAEFEEEHVEVDKQDKYSCGDGITKTHHLITFINKIKHVLAPSMLIKTQHPNVIPNPTGRTPTTHV